jgi:hypothetical protein
VRFRIDCRVRHLEICVIHAQVDRRLHHTPGRNCCITLAKHSNSTNDKCNADRQRHAVSLVTIVGALREG